MINSPCYQSFHSKQYLNISKIDAVLIELAKGSCPWGSYFLCVTDLPRVKRPLGNFHGNMPTHKKKITWDIPKGKYRMANNDD